ncbi:hypothetical protein BC830DRAFT_1170416, partial [Chytriomyces sp. MP71]
MSSSLPASATETMNSLLSSFKPFASTVASQASKGISQGLQFTKEAMGRSNDVTELPDAYKALEVQVDAVKNLHEQFLKISTNYTRKGYDYQPPLSDTALNYASTMKQGFTHLISGSAPAP